MRQRQDQVRRPKQARSLHRVDLILEAARQLIAERGLAGLAIVEIAERAEITSGSMYQYFPNKTAIVAALAERYFAEMEARMAVPLGVLAQDPAQAADVIEQIVELVYQMNLQDPVLRDILQGLVSDRVLADLSRRDTEAKVDLLCAALAPTLAPGRSRDDLRLSVALLTEFVEAAVRVALDQPAREGRRLIDRLKAMVRTVWLAGV